MYLGRIIRSTDVKGSGWNGKKGVWLFKCTYNVYYDRAMREQKRAVLQQILSNEARERCKIALII